MSQSNYVHQNNSDLSEYERLQKLEPIFDPRSRSFLEKIGIPSGSSFLEAGAGGGALLPWLLEKVGDSGEVIAVDLNIRFISPLQHPRLEVIQGDLTQIDLGKERFDFIHERFVLTHIPDYERVLQKMRTALKPGGWILLEDSDFSAARLETKNSSLLNSFNAVLHARELLFRQKQMDFSFGKNLPSLLTQAGFKKVQSENFAPLDPGGSGTAEIMKLSTLQLGPQYRQTGAASEEDLRAFITLTSDPSQSAVYYSTISAWGQKPL